MTFESIIALFIAMVLITIKPGPGMMAVITRSLNDGFFAALMIGVGISTFHLFYYSLAVFSITLSENDLLFFSFLLKSLGAAYLIYIGIKGFIHLERGLWGGKVDIQTKINPLENFMTGAAITLANPFIILFYSAILPNLMNLKDLQLNAVLLSAIIIFSTNLGILALEAVMAGKVKERLKNPKIVKSINVLTSASFILLGIFIGLTLLPVFDFDLAF